MCNGPKGAYFDLFLMNCKFEKIKFLFFSSLAARDARSLAEDEAVIVSLFGHGDLDVSKSTVEFDLAAIMGRKVGENHCNVVYSRCAYAPATLMEVMRQPDFNRI